MLKDVWFESPFKVAMHKKLFAPEELALARCLWLEYNEEKSIVYADLLTTTDKALNEFLKAAFRNFMHNDDAKLFRDKFFVEVRQKYDIIFSDIYSTILTRAPYHEKLFQHQRHALATMAHKKYNLLSFEMGLGKTLTSATHSMIHKLKRTVVICPALVKWNWYRDLTDKRWGFNELYFTILDASKRRTVTAFQERFVILNYEMVDRYHDYLLSQQIDHVIIDECRYIKNHNSARFKAIKKLLEKCPDARVTYLSGTPIKNRVNDAFAYFKLIGHPLGENYTQFLREYTQASQTRGGALRITGGKNLQDLWSKMSNFMIRRTKKECLDLPDKIITKLRFELSDYRDEYNKIIKEMAEQKDISNLHSCLHSLNIVVAKSKIPGIIEHAENILEQGEKVVIYSGYKEPLEMLKAHFGKRCVKIDGSVPSYERDKLIQKFLREDDCTVFLGNMIAGGIGINLVNASNMITTNFPLTPPELWQAEDRLHRIGQNKSVNIFYTVCEDTIDDHLDALIADKAGDINQLIDRGKEAIDYGGIPEMLYKKLMESYGREVPEHP